MTMSDSLYTLCRSIAARPAAAVLGRRAEQAVTRDAFLARVGAWRALLDGCSGKNYALHLEDSVDFGAALLGAWQAGKTIWLSADTLDASCHALHAAVDGYLGEFPAQWQPLRPDPEVTIAATDYHVLEPDFAALVVQTSGTTGAAQAIPKRLSQLAAEVATLEVLFGAQAGAAEVVATVSHQHIYGLLFKVLWPLCAGRAIHALSLNYPEQMIDALGRCDCLLITSPAHLKRLPEHLDWRPAAASLRAVFSSGGPLSPEVGQAAAALLGQHAIEVYGSSETGGIAWRSCTVAGDLSWYPMPGIAWRSAVDSDLLEVCSPHLPDEQWMRMADRIERLDDTRFLLKGRSDRIVKLEEKRVSLDGIEAVLAASSLVAAVRILLCEEIDVQRQRLAAFIVLTDAGRAVLAQEGKLALNLRLREALGTAVEAIAIPRRWRYLEQMPVDAQGKTTHALLTALLDVRPREPRLRELAREQHHVSLELVVPANLLYFDGHFDQMAILPGVVQLDWAITIGRRYFALPTEFKSVHALKFQQLILAEQVISLELNHDAQKDTLSFRYFSTAGQHASGRIFFGHAPAPLTASQAGTDHV
jgi:acyl-coenzyme A synthetase/AMP-(fatty) acid ligase